MENDNQRLCDELSALRQSVDAIRNQYERENQQRQIEQAVPKPSIKVDAEIHEQENIQKEKRSHEKRNFWLQLALTIGTWAHSSLPPFMLA